MQTDNLRIGQTHPLIAPAVLEEEFPLDDEGAAFIAQSRATVRNILRGQDKRLIVVVGPCSIHDVDAALEYAGKLKVLAEQVSDQLFVVMRVYFEKPRTTVGWKGLIYDPDLDGSHRINKGLRLARGLLMELARMRIPTATEFLDATFGQYYTDLITWGAIGARTVESQIHRQLASALSMPVGIKNRTDGDIEVAIDAIEAAAHKHLFPTLTKEGAPAILETTGNPDCHLVLRGGDQPNYDVESIRRASTVLATRGVNNAIMVDCSHANSRKDPTRQGAIAKEVSSLVRGLMIESHLRGGRQDISTELTYGQSITDACLGFEETAEVLRGISSTTN